LILEVSATITHVFPAYEEAKRSRDFTHSALRLALCLSWSSKSAFFSDQVFGVELGGIGVPNGRGKKLNSLSFSFSLPLPLGVDLMIGLDEGVVGVAALAEVGGGSFDEEASLAMPAVVLKHR
jgi:hypothetical protein